MVRRNYVEPNKITLVGWVDKALDLTFTRKNIMSGFKGTRIWPLNPNALDSKTSISILYTLHNQNREEKELEQKDGEHTTYNYKGPHQHRLKNKSSKLLIYLKINLGVM